MLIKVAFYVIMRNDTSLLVGLVIQFVVHMSCVLLEQMEIADITQDAPIKLRYGQELQTSNMETGNAKKQ